MNSLIKFTLYGLLSGAKFSGLIVKLSKAGGILVNEIKRVALSVVDSHGTGSMHYN
jgi:hypothetical protein